MAELGNDAILEILSRLPVKTLCRFKCVSKPWNEFISDPNFRTRQPCMLLVECSSKRMMLEQNNALMSMRVSWIDTQGTVLNSFQKQLPFVHWFSNLCGDFFCISLFNDIYLCNPYSTQQLVVLPPASYPDSRHTGFGYLCETGEYKVVRLYNFQTHAACEIFTFSKRGTDFASCSWKTLEETLPYTVRKHGVFLNTSIYWVSHSWTQKDQLIVALDLRNEKFRTISCPSDFSLIDYKGSYLWDLGGSLCWIERIADYSFERINIWRLKDEESSEWVKEYTINNLFASALCSYPRFLHKGEILFAFSKGLNIKLYSYNLVKGEYRKVDYIMPAASHVLGIEEKVIHADKENRRIFNFDS